MTVLELSGIGPDITLAELEDEIVAAAGSDVYDALWFDETDNSWTNFCESTNIRIGPNYPASSTGDDDYEVTLPSGISSFSIGNVYSFIADVANTGAATVDFNSIGAKDIVLSDGSALPNNTIKAGFRVDVRWDGTDMIFVGIHSNNNVTSAKAQRFQSNTQGWMNIVNAMASLRQVHLATPFPKE